MREAVSLFLLGVLVGLAFWPAWFWIDWKRSTPKKFYD